jgi:hypothetical protein
MEVDASPPSRSGLTSERFASLCPFPPEAIRHFSKAEKVIDIPDNIYGIFQIASNLLEVSPYAKKLLSKDDVSIKQFEQLLQFSRYIGRVQALHPWRELDELGASSINQQDEVSNPLTGVRTTHPVWEAMWFRSGTQNSPKRDAL